MLTPEQRQKYIESEGARCPECEQDEITLYGGLKMNGPVVTQDCYCRSCGLNWKDVYRLVDVETIVYAGDQNEP